MTYFCANCGKRIPDEIIKKRRNLKSQIHHCNQQCDIERRKKENHFKTMGALGNQSQQCYKQERGIVPGYEQRKVALAASNSDHPRRTRKSK